MRRLLAGLAACVGLLFAAPGPAAPLTPAEHLRTPDQTFLTVPEWYLVHSPAEYAAYLARAPQPSRFPLFAHIGQFWQSYAAVATEIRQFPFNGGYHLMVMVIGVSTTVEYSLKGAYEHTVGRLAEATRSQGNAGPSQVFLTPSGGGLGAARPWGLTDAAAVPEEQFAARLAQSYVDFIRVDPWYLYDFGAQLRQLWADVPLGGPNLIRRWERRFALTSELLVKQGYARLIKLGSQSVYDAPQPVTAVVLSRAPVADDKDHGDYKLLEPGRDDASVLATVPRYEGFTRYSRWLAAQGIDFRAIAGNSGEVVVSELGPYYWQPTGVRVLFEQPILTQPGRKRVVFAVTVPGLAAELRRAQAMPDRIVVEHIYDF